MNIRISKSPNFPALCLVWCIKTSAFSIFLRIYQQITPWLILCQRFFWLLSYDLQWLSTKANGQIISNCPCSSHQPQCLWEAVTYRSISNGLIGDGSMTLKFQFSQVSHLHRSETWKPPKHRHAISDGVVACIYNKVMYSLTIGYESCPIVMEH